MRCLLALTACLSLASATCQHQHSRSAFTYGEEILDEAAPFSVSAKEAKEILTWRQASTGTPEWEQAWGDPLQTSLEGWLSGLDEVEAAAKAIFNLRHNLGDSDPESFGDEANEAQREFIKRNYLKNKVYLARGALQATQKVTSRLRVHGDGLIHLQGLWAAAVEAEESTNLDAPGAATSTVEPFPAALAGMSARANWIRGRWDQIVQGQVLECVKVIEALDPGIDDFDITLNLTGVRDVLDDVQAEVVTLRGRRFYVRPLSLD